MVDFRTSALAVALFVSGTQSSAQQSPVDPATAPGDDFYSYANARWLNSVQLPAGAAKIDTTSILRAQNSIQVAALIAKAVQDAATSTNSQGIQHKIADYYLSQLDTAAIAARGIAPLAAELDRIAAIHDRTALSAELGRQVRLDDGSNQRTESLLGLWVHQNFHDPDRYAAHLVQGGLGLGEPIAYVSTDSDAVDVRSRYVTHIAAILQLGGVNNPDPRALRVLELETAIAATHASRADTDDVHKTDNTWHRADFGKRAAGMDWPAYFDAAALYRAPSFVVWQPRAVIGSAGLVASQPLEVWRDYLTFHLIEHYGSALPDSIGAKAGASNRESRATAATEAAFGDALGRIYAASHFPLRNRIAATRMTENIRTAFRSRLTQLRWMTKATRTKALAKLAALRIGLGYPDTWIDYAPLAVIRGDAIGNLRRAERFAYEREVAMLTRRVEQDEWAGQLHPQMVGAILNISPNSMQFAAGLLQPPYFDANGDAAANYGSAGAGIAHEISHSFDELGNQYDAQGRLESWWTKSDLDGYRRAADGLAVQLDTCMPVPGHPAKGRQVLAESTADLAGLAVAFDAYHLAQKGRPDRPKSGLSGDQRFFIAFAQRWRRLQTGDSLLAQIENDSHAPPQCRSNLVRNLDAWVRAFGVDRSKKLFLLPKSRFRIW